MTDFRALCAELADRLDDALTYTVQSDTERSMRQLITRARAALAKAEPQGPSDEDLDDLANEMLDWNCEGWRAYARAAIAADRARWDRPTIEPVPVSERPWEREGWYDLNGMCWLYLGHEYDGIPRWIYVHFLHATDGEYTHSLPYNALPVRRYSSLDLCSLPARH
jgi:hypothetical protein